MQRLKYLFIYVLAFQAYAYGSYYDYERRERYTTGISLSPHDPRCVEALRQIRIANAQTRREEQEQQRREKLWRQQNQQYLGLPQEPETPKRLSKKEYEAEKARKHAEWLQRKEERARKQAEWQERQEEKSKKQQDFAKRDATRQQEIERLWPIYLQQVPQEDKRDTEQYQREEFKQAFTQYRRIQYQKSTGQTCNKDMTDSDHNDYQHFYDFFAMQKRNTSQQYQQTANSSSSSTATQPQVPNIKDREAFPVLLPKADICSNKQNQLALKKFNTNFAQEHEANYQHFLRHGAPINYENLDI